MLTKTPVKRKKVIDTLKEPFFGVSVILDALLSILRSLKRLTGVARNDFIRARARIRVLLVLALASVSLGGGMAVTLTAAQPATTHAATASTFNFQARLMNSAGAIVPDGNYNVEFKLYNDPITGTAQWTEDYLNSASHGVQVKNGYLTANLGSITGFPNSINWDQQEFLTMNIGGISTGAPSWDGEMNPRLALTAIPYAFKAGQLAQFNSATGFTSTLSLLQPTGGNQTFQIADQGAVGTYNLLTANTANANYIQKQSATAQSSSTFWISGAGKADLFNAVTGLQTAGTTRVDASGNLSNIGSINSAGNLSVLPSGLGNIVNLANNVVIGAGFAGNQLTLKGDGGGKIILENGNQGPFIDLTGSANINNTIAVLTPAFQVRNAFANSTQPLAVFQLGATPGTGNDTVQYQSSTGVILGKVDSNGYLYAGSVDTVGTSGTLNIGTSNASTINIGGAVLTSTANIATGYNIAAATLKVAKDSGTGRSINAAGTINASGADYAEYYYQKNPGTLQPQQIACLVGNQLVDVCGSEGVITGVVSANAGYIGNDIYDMSNPGNSAIIGMPGQLPVKVSVAYGAIHAGDPVGLLGGGVGAKQTEAGHIVGWAMEDAAADGTINVMVRPQYYTPTSASSMQGGNDGVYATLNVNGATNIGSLNVSGQTILKGLKVAGTATITGDANIGGALTVTSLTTVSSIIVNDDIEVHGHYVSKGTLPTIVVGSAGGAGDGQHDETKPVVTIEGTDNAGTITIVTGQSQLNKGSLATVTFSKTFGTRPRIVISGSNDNASNLRIYLAKTLTGFQVMTRDVPTGMTNYQFDFLVQQSEGTISTITGNTIP
jgi:hypothetical protein